MKRVAIVLALMLFALPAVAAEDFSGSWTGSFTGVGPDGQTHTESILTKFVQKGADLTGTAGPNEQNQWAIQKGKVDGVKVAFEVQPGGDGNGPALRFTLALDEGHLKGDINAEMEGQKLTGKVDLARAK